MNFRALAWLVILSFAVPASAQPDDEPRPQPPEDLIKVDKEVVDLAQQLGDWTEQHQIISSAIESMWDQNGWSTEADLFAKDTALRLSRIPPWKFQDRVQEFQKTIRGRFQLDDEQAAQFRKIMYRELWNMTLKYGPVIYKQAKEGLNTRLRNEPFTAEQVARWAKEYDPFIEEYLKDLERITKEFDTILTEEQRKIYQHDMESMNKRLEHFTQAHQIWKSGGWQPADWGLQNDPLHQKTERQDTHVPPVSPPASAVIEYDESTWSQYVIAFIKRFQLDEAQQKACTNILDDLVARAQHYRSAHNIELDKITPVERIKHPLFAPIRQMFEELKNRLNVIPTEAQRGKASKPAALRSTKEEHK